MRQGNGQGFGGIRRTGLWRIAALCIAALTSHGVLAGHSAPTARQADALADLSLEELTSVRITSVSRRPERLVDAPASIYVITADDIRRAGVTSLPEALRLAPNLQVARIEGSQYAISARGFNNSVGNKLLVLIDGRTVYTPLFSGVFWDQQDLMLQDVERIEVISGPGATLWGANAVNGVINVITRSARDTQGVLAAAHAGNQERGASLRFGGQLPGGHYRAYAKTTERDNNKFANGNLHYDARETAQLGFRADWRAGRDQFTLQGDTYSSTGEDPGQVIGIQLGRFEARGSNLLGRWSRTLEGGSDLRAQAYFDTVHRRDRVLFQPDAEIFDVEMQHGIPLGNHRFLWGGGYRKGRDEVQDGALSGFRPMSSDLEWYNVFAQGEAQLTTTVELTLGLKLEHNDYTGVENLPSLRLSWKPASDHLLWAAASRAVRAPSRFDRDVTVPAFQAFFLGGPNFESEVAEVLELGYRAQPTPAFTWSMTLFHHEWDKLRSGTTLPLILENRIYGSVYGIEGWAAWQVTPAWRLSGGLATLRKNLKLESGSTDPVGVDNVTLANDPEFQWTLRSAYQLGPHQLDVMMRRVGALPEPAVEAYTAVDLRYAWQLRPDTEVSLTVQNLFDSQHAEFRPSANAPISFERSILLGLRWQQ